MVSEYEARLSVLWVLLNISTELNMTSDIIKIMDAIEERCKKERLLEDYWRKDIKIIVDDKLVYERKFD